MPTIHEVAKAAGVSPTTVSRSFSDSSLLSEKTRLRVLEAAKSLNYRPPHARPRRGLSTPSRSNRRGGAIGFQFFAPSDTATVQTDAFYAPMLIGAQAEAQELGLHLLLHTTNRHRLSDELPSMIRDQAIVGMLLVGTADPGILAAFLQHVLQIVLVDNRDAAGRHDCVLSDGIGGAFAATSYLLGLGHRRVGFVMSDPQTATFQDRLTGYLSAHFKAGVSADPGLIVSAGPEDDFSTLVQGLLTRSERPTAVLAANDPHAYSLMQICRNLNLNIPGDISVIGFDDDKYSALSYPPLTTMHVETEYMGRLAVRRLQARLLESVRAATPEPAINVEVPVSLVVRDSCRPWKAR